MVRGEPRVSVIVATRNRADRLERLLAALRAQALDRDLFEVIVVDDGSSDGTPDLLAKAERADGPRVRVTKRDHPGGPAIARNQGVRLARADLIAFTDDDCEPAPGWLEAGLAAWGGRPDRFVQGGTVPNPAERHLLGPFTRTVEITELTPSYQTCNMFYPRALLDELAGFDESYAFWGEDTDLAWRAIERGARPLFAPGAVVHHAVNRLGPLGTLRLAASWAPAMRPYAEHPELRRTAFTHGVFWKREHYWLVRTLLAVILPRRWRPVRIWLALPYLRMLRARTMVSGTGPALVPFLALRDMIELVAVIAGAARYRAPML